MNHLEEENVLNVYNEIAKEFDKTRYNIWESVNNFIKNFEPNSVIGDIGCGNGKNMLIRKDCDFLGCDFSNGMVEICKKKGLNVIEGNLLNIPFKDNYFDYTLCIAALHHLSTKDHRQKAVNELARITKKNGKILIVVWALEQPKNLRFKFNNQDSLIDWKNKKGEILGKRFYHFFKKGELEELCKDYNIINSYYEEGNWGIIIHPNGVH